MRVLLSQAQTFLLTSTNTNSLQPSVTVSTDISTFPRYFTRIICDLPLLTNMSKYVNYSDNVTSGVISQTPEFCVFFKKN